MSCNCKYNCNGLALASSLIIGIVAAILSFTALIAIAPVFYWVVFGIAVLYLAIILIVSSSNRYGEKKRCLCVSLPLLLSGILGSILSSLILLAVGFAVTSILGTIIIGAAIFFFSLIFTSTACLIKCLSDCDD